MKKDNAFQSGIRTSTRDPVERILDAIDLKWSVLKAPVEFTPERAALVQRVKVDSYSVLFRSDTKETLAIASSSHQPWQPREIIDFYFSVSAFYGLAIERWAMCKEVESCGRC